MRVSVGLVVGGALLLTLLTVGCIPTRTDDKPAPPPASPVVQEPKAPAPPVYSNEPLPNGSEEMRELQTLLNRVGGKHGFSAGTPDGLFGKRTRQAICEFQQIYELEQHCEPTEGVLARLREALGIAGPPAQATSEGGIALRAIDDSDSVSLLLGGEVAEIGVTRLGSSRFGDPELAAALGSSPAKGSDLGGGRYAPSGFERALHAVLRNRPGYSDLQNLLNPDKSRNPRASANFVLDYGRTEVNEVQYVPGRFRRSLFFEIGLSFVVLDDKGREVYRNRVDKQKLYGCTYAQGEPCVYVVVNRQLSNRAIWKDVLNEAMDELLVSTRAGLAQWGRLLASVRAEVVLKVRGKTLRLQKNAAVLRNLESAKRSFLLLQVPPMAQTAALRRDLQARGGNDAKALEQQLTLAFKGGFDAALRRGLDRSASGKESAIFLVPEAGSQWFRQTLDRVIADAINDGETELVITEYGTQEELPDYLENFGGLCRPAVARSEGHRCMNLKLSYGGSETKSGGSRVGASVEEARQLVTAAGNLHEPIIKAAGCPRKDCYFPHGISAAKDRIVYAAKGSDFYIRALGAAARDNDDRVYFRSAAVKAFEDLGADLAERVLQTYREEFH